MDVKVFIIINRMRRRGVNVGQKKKILIFQSTFTLKSFFFGNKTTTKIFKQTNINTYTNTWFSKRKKIPSIWNQNQTQDKGCWWCLFFGTENFTAMEWNEFHWIIMFSFIDFFSLDQYLIDFKQLIVVVVDELLILKKIH